MFQSEFFSSFNTGSSVIPALHFSILILLLFALGLPLGQDLLPLLPVVLWVGLLLSILLHTNRIVQEDCEDGYVAQLLLSPTPLWWLLAQQQCGRWLGFMLPYSVMSFLVLMGLGCGIGFTTGALLALMIGSLSLFALGGVGAALTLGARQASLLLPMILLPLYIPTLIFGSQCLYALGENGGQVTQLWFYLLCANTIFCCTISPYFMGAALKVSQW